MKMFTLKYIFIVIFFFFFASAFAQKSKIDSLNKLLLQVENEKRVDVLAELSLEYSKDSNNFKKKYADEALELARKLNYKKGEGLALYSLAYYHYKNSENIKAEELINEAHTVNLVLHDSLLIADAYSLNGFIVLGLTKYTEAIDYLKKANRFYGGMHNDRKYRNIEAIGIAEFNLTNYKSALKYILYAVKYYEQNNKYSKIPHLKDIIGTIYIRTGEKDLGLNYLQKVFTSASAQENDFVSAESLYSIGEFYKNEKQIDSALHYLNRAIKYAIKIDQKLMISDIYTYKGDCFLMLEQYDSAAIYYHKVIDISERISDNWAIVYGNIGLAKVNSKQGNYGKSLYYLHKIKPAVEEINSKEMLQDFYAAFSEVYALKRNYKEAYRYQLLYRDVSNRLHDENIAKQLADLKVNYQTEKKEQENKRLIAENKLKEQSIKNRDYIVYGISIILLFAIFFAFVFFNGKQKIRKANILLKEKNQEIQNQNEEITVQSEELLETYAKLKELDEFKQGLTNMIVHDLKNPLNIILNLSQEKLVVEAGSKMLNLITNILDVSKFEEAKMSVARRRISLHEVVGIAIEKTNFAASISGIEVVNEVDNLLQVDADFDLSERIFINLLTNAIKFSPRNEKIYFYTKDDSDNNFVKIFVKDSGRGIPEEFKDKIFDRFTQVTAINSASMRSTGLGLTFCKLAVEAHGGEIGVESETKSGAIFWLTLPKAAS